MLIFSIKVYHVVTSSFLMITQINRVINNTIPINKINKYRRTNKTAYTLGISNETKIKIKNNNQLCSTTLL